MSTLSVSWFERLVTSIVDRGRTWVRLPANLSGIERAIELARQLVSGLGEASGAALASSLVTAYRGLGPEDRLSFLLQLATHYAPDEAALSAAARAYLEAPGPKTAAELAEASDPPRQELLRRINLAVNGTEILVAMRREVLLHRAHAEVLAPLEHDLRHLLTSWFNRGFLELRRIDWNTSAAVLEKLIEYEAVHEIKGWSDLRRRLEDDRRCFAFFHPALRNEPLIFVEVALVRGLARAIEPLLAASPDGRSEDGRSETADTAIFYSISNCQAGLRGITFGNFLIKQVVEDLKAEMPGLTRFGTLSPVPGFRAWLDRRRAEQEVLPEELVPVLERFLEDPSAESDDAADARLQHTLAGLCAAFLTRTTDSRGPEDSVARFHLRNGARLERIDPRGNISARGLQESYGVMVNYLYDPQQIEANHERFVRFGEVVSAPEVQVLARGEDVPGRTVGSTRSRARRR